MEDNSTVSGEYDGKLFDYDGMSDCNYSESATSTSETSKVDRIRELDKKIQVISKETQASRARKSQCKQKLRNLIERCKQMEDIYEQIGVKMEPKLIVLENEISKVQPIISRAQSLLKSLQDYIDYKSIKLELLNLDSEEMETESSPNNATIHYPTEEQIISELMERASLENSNINFGEYSSCFKEKQLDYSKLMKGGIRHYNEMLKRYACAQEKCVTECITIPDTQPFDPNF